VALEEQKLVKHPAEVQGHGQVGPGMNNKIQKIKKAIMSAFPNADGVIIRLDDDIMEVSVIPWATAEDDDIETIIVEGRKSWKSTE